MKTKLIILSIIFSLSIGLFLTFHIRTIAALDGIWYLADMVNTIKDSAASEHVISFTLPTSSLPIFTTDYINIYFQEYSDVTIPSMLSGAYGGIPVYSKVGNWIKITGITLPPGGQIGIHGIHSTNPPIYDMYQVVVVVSEDEAMSRVKNQAVTYATLFRGHVSVTATIESQLAELQISGYTAPGTFVIFTESGAVIGTDVAGVNGYFSKVFSGLQPTTHYISYYGIDTQNRATSSINLQLYTPPRQRIAVTDQLLSPTLELNHSQILQGNTLVASGSAMPGANLTIFTDSPLRTYYASASGLGRWSFSVSNINEYVYGDYRLYTIAQNSYGLQSLISHALSFSVMSNLGGGTSCGDITQGDLNCDNSIDLTDFSILMYYWATQNISSDINADGIVNLTDFSILMYYWGT
jgi:hypothetical protein